MSEITQAQFERVIERLANNNKALSDLVDFHAKENDRLRWALKFILGAERLNDAHVAARTALEEKE